MIAVLIDEFLHPARLLLLAVVALLAVGYVVVLRWRRRATVRFTQVDLLDSVVPRRPGWRRHVVAAANVLGLAIGVVAVAQPVTTELVRVESEGRIVLLFDVSSSMSATDVEPSRFQAAKDAAEAFIAQVDPEVEIGLVSFSGTVTVENSPTLDRAVVVSAIQRLRLAPSTAIGDAIATGTRMLVDLQRDGDGDGEDAMPDVAPGALVVLTDGETTRGIETQEGADIAAAAGVPVFTISFGTPFGTITDPVTGDELSVPVLPEPLEQAAASTGGEAYEAASPEELADAYAQIRDVLQETLGEEVERVTEQTWKWAAGAIGLLALGWALSLWWLRGLV